MKSVTSASYGMTWIKKTKLKQNFFKYGTKDDNKNYYK